LLQFIVMSVGLVAVTVLILEHVGWSRMVAAVESHYGAGGFNPFVNEKLGLAYVLNQTCVVVAATLTWQTVVARVLSAKDTRTARKVFTGTSFFFACRFVIPGLWGIAALAMLPSDALSALPGNMAESPSLHAMPVFLSSVVPVGLMGLLIASMLAADMSTDSSYMLTWGSVIYNDLLAPWHRGRWSERFGIACNRLIVAAIGLFLLGYGLWLPVQGNVWDYLAVTGTIYLASMSTLLIACCYWSAANSWGAMAAIGTGATIPLAFLILQHLAATRELVAGIGPYYSGIAAYVGAGIAMIVGSLAKRFFTPAATGARVP
jgi:SSS family solute:Na+ symporter